MTGHINIATAVPVFDGGGMREYFDGSDGCSIIRISNTTKQEYDNYLTALSDNGFILHADNNIRDNYFTTYYNDIALVQVYYTAHDSSVRIVVDDNYNLYDCKNALTYKDVCSTALYQMETDYRTIDCGMCYIIQCADGSFFIIDSAHMNSIDDHFRLYELLRKLTPQGKDIVIAGWFFSHAHQDHIAMFMKFLKSGYRDCRIECIYYNFPAYNVLGAEKWKENDIQTRKEFEALVKAHTEIQIRKPHTGQKFYVRNLEFNVLTTHEDIYPLSLACFNDSCTILMLSVDNSKVLFLGDANVTECTVLVSRYGAFLKSDIIQVAHHGYNAANVGIYFCAAAPVSLYPTRQEKFDENANTESNKRVVEFSKEIYIAGNGMVSLSLPYKLGTSKVSPKEINA